MLLKNKLHMHKQWTDESKEFSSPLTTLNLNGDESVKKWRNEYLKKSVLWQYNK